jgi:hypothetical protein
VCTNKKTKKDGSHRWSIHVRSHTTSTVAGHGSQSCWMGDRSSIWGNDINANTQQRHTTLSYVSWTPALGPAIMINSHFLFNFNCLILSPMSRVLVCYGEDLYSVSPPIGRMNTQRCRGSVSLGDNLALMDKWAPLANAFVRTAIEMATSIIFQAIIMMSKISGYHQARRIMRVQSW